MLQCKQSSSSRWLARPAAAELLGAGGLHADEPCWSTPQPALACLKSPRQAEEAAAWQQLQQAERAAEDLQYERKLHMQSVAAEKDPSTLCVQDAGTRLATELVEEVHAETAETAAAADCQHKSTGEAGESGERGA